MLVLPHAPSGVRRNDDDCTMFMHVYRSKNLPTIIYNSESLLKTTKHFLLAYNFPNFCMLITDLSYNLSHTFLQQNCNKLFCEAYALAIMVWGLTEQFLLHVQGQKIAGQVKCT